MAQETLYEGILRGLREKKHVALLIVGLAIILTTVLHRVFPPTYQSHALLRVLTTENLPGESLAASMQGILSQWPEVVTLSRENRIRTFWGGQSEFYQLEDVGPGLVQLEILHTDPEGMKILGDTLVQILSKQFLKYSSESDHFDIEALEMKKRAILEKMIAIRREKEPDGLYSALMGVVEKTDGEDKLLKLNEEVEGLRNLMAGTPKVRVISSQEQSPEFEEARKALKKSRSKLAELLLNYREKHPKVVKAGREVDKWSQLVRSFSANKDRKEENPEFLALLKEVTDKEIQISELQQEQKNFQEMLTASAPSFLNGASFVHQRLMALKSMYDESVLRQEELEMKKATAQGKIQVLRKNHEFPNRTGLSLVQRELLGLFSGAFFAIVLLYTPKQMELSAERLAISNAALLGFGGHFNDPEAVRRMMRVPLLPGPGMETKTSCLTEHDERLIVLNEPESRVLVPMKALLANLQIQLAETGARVLMVCSSRGGMGRTALVANLGVLFAQEGYQIVLVDANFRKPALHKVFELDSFRGLSTLLQGQKNEDTIQKTKIPGLSVIAAGPIPQNSLELLSSITMKQLLDALKRRYEIVLVDSPGLLDYPDAKIIAGQVGGVVALSREGESAEDNRACREFLQNLKSRVLGFVTSQ